MATRRPRSAIDDNAATLPNMPDAPSPLSRDAAASGASRQRADQFPLIGNTHEERYVEIQKYMQQIHDHFTSLVTRIENKADRTFSWQADSFRNDIKKMGNRIDGIDVKMRNFVEKDVADTFTDKAKQDALNDELRGRLDLLDDAARDMRLANEQTQAHIQRIGDIDRKLGVFEANIGDFNKKVEAWAESKEAKDAMTKATEDAVKGIVSNEFGKVDTKIEYISSELRRVSTECEATSLNLATATAQLIDKADKIGNDIVNGPVTLIGTRLDSLQHRMDIIESHPRMTEPGSSLFNFAQRS